MFQICASGTLASQENQNSGDIVTVRHGLVAYDHIGHKDIHLNSCIMRLNVALSNGNAVFTVYIQYIYIFIYGHDNHPIPALISYTSTHHSTL